MQFRKLQATSTNQNDINIYVTYMSGKVEVGMVCEVDNCSFISDRGRVVNDDSVLISQLINDLYV